MILTSLDRCSKSIPVNPVEQIFIPWNADIMSPLKFRMEERPYLEWEIAETEY
jgi:hypothetical protein